LDRIELRERPVDERLQLRIQRHDRRGDTADETREVFLLGVAVPLLGRELCLKLRGTLACELPLIERLHRRLPRQAARAYGAVGARAHSQTSILRSRLASSSAASAASTPLLTALLPERSTACSIVSVVS